MAPGAEGRREKIDYSVCCYYFKTHTVRKGRHSAGEAAESREDRKRRRGESGVRSLRTASSGCRMKRRRRMGAE